MILNSRGSIDMGRKNGSIIGKFNVGAGVTYNASGIWGLNNVQEFNNDSNPLQSAIKLRVLCQAGGGGGGGSRTNEIRGGGGGGGGQVEGFFLMPPTNEIYVSVGNGGNGGYNYTPGSRGYPSHCGPWPQNSQLFLAYGGGGGYGYQGYSPSYQGQGGTGGGGNGNSNPTVRNARYGQGFPGGDGSGYPDAGSARGGGGGGAGGAAESLAPPSS